MERSNPLLSKCRKWVGDWEKQNGAVWDHVAESDAGAGDGRMGMGEYIFAYVCLAFFFKER